eukprot:TRINITY_DN10274_c0_g1_i1.p1 TRINITY_DN10274_c0_g1~~TRINITY_DN10274_c0_g1_i1.p1  ORF type:complete len:673 (-),score=107.33 TRINITY_DN10274_c0_g1_i1:29-2047(-)
MKTTMKTTTRPPIHRCQKKSSSVRGFTRSHSPTGLKKKNSKKTSSNPSSPKESSSSLSGSPSPLASTNFANFGSGARDQLPQHDATARRRSMRHTLKKMTSSDSSDGCKSPKSSAKPNSLPAILDSEDTKVKKVSKSRSSDVLVGEDPPPEKIKSTGSFRNSFAKLTRLTSSLIVDDKNVESNLRSSSSLKSVGPPSITTLTASSDIPLQRSSSNLLASTTTTTTTTTTATTSSTPASTATTSPTTCTSTSTSAAPNAVGGKNASESSSGNPNPATTSRPPIFEKTTSTPILPLAVPRKMISTPSSKSHKSRKHHRSESAVNFTSPRMERKASKMRASSKSLSPKRSDSGSSEEDEDDDEVEMSSSVGPNSFVKIHWKHLRFLTSGTSPSVSIQRDTILVVYKKGCNESDVLVYKTGRILSDDIEWIGGGIYGTGTSPNVAFNLIGQVIETHCDNRTRCYTVGVFDFTNFEITWGPSTPFTEHVSGIPSGIGITNIGEVMDTHYVPAVVFKTGASLIFHQCGVIDTQKLRCTWKAPKKHSNGRAPKVAVRDSTFVALHSSGSHVYTRIGKMPGEKGQIRWLSKTTMMNFEDDVLTSVGCNRSGDIFFASIFRNRLVFHAGYISHNCTKICMIPINDEVEEETLRKSGSVLNIFEDGTERPHRRKLLSKSTKK